MCCAGCRGGQRVPGPVPGRPEPGQDPAGAEVQRRRRQVWLRLRPGGWTRLQGGVVRQQQQVNNASGRLASSWMRFNSVDYSVWREYLVSGSPFYCTSWSKAKMKKFKYYTGCGGWEWGVEAKNSKIKANQWVFSYIFSPRLELLTGNASAPAYLSLKEPRNRFQEIDSAMLGIDSWLPYKRFTNSDSAVVIKYIQKNLGCIQRSHSKTDLAKYSQCANIFVKILFK